MPKLALYNCDGEQVGELEVQAGLFAAPLMQGALYQTAMSQAAKQRQGTSATRDRSEVRGGGVKPWPQKGTGRARAGTSRSPIWVGGGTVFGPHPRNYGYSVPKKVRRAALRSALSAKASDAKVLVLDDLSMNEPKTREMVRVLDNLKATTSTLLVIAQPDQNIIKSVRNLPGVKTTVARQLNVLDILSYNHLVITRDALEKVQEVFGE